MPHFGAITKVQFRFNPLSVGFEPTTSEPVAGINDSQESL